MSVLASVQMTCDVKVVVNFSRSPMFLSLCLCSSKKYRNILVAELTDFGDNLKSLSKIIYKTIFSLISFEVLLTITKKSYFHNQEKLGSEI